MPPQGFCSTASQAAYSHAPATVAPGWLADLISLVLPDWKFPGWSSIG
jgi:hypothetical protein